MGLDGADEKSLVSDEKGPERYPTRIRISVKDLVIFRERMSQTRSLDMVGKSMKSPDDAAIQKNINAVLTGQGMDLLCSTGELDFDDPPAHWPHRPAVAMRRVS